MPIHPNIEGEIIAAEQRAKSAEHDYLSSRTKYWRMRKQVKGPFTVGLIAAEAQYRQACRERTRARYRLRGLLAIQKKRKK